MTITRSNTRSSMMPVRLWVVAEARGLIRAVRDAIDVAEREGRCSTADARALRGELAQASLSSPADVPPLSAVAIRRADRESREHLHAEVSKLRERLLRTQRELRLARRARAEKDVPTDAAGGTGFDRSDNLDMNRTVAHVG
jgi:hypothetical protein